MKTILAFTLLFLIAPVHFLRAQNEIDTVAQKKFAGVWQMCQVNNEVLKIDPIAGVTIDTTKLTFFYFYKFFSKGGEYVALAISNTGSSINSSGTYDVFSDKYIENFSSYVNSSQTKSELPYVFFGDNHFLMSYTSPDGRTTYEIWKRIHQMKINQ